jgi:hypothetical protein
MKDKNLNLIFDEVQSQVSALKDIPDVVKLLINLVEALVEKTDKLEKENQQLKDEINKLKGETTPPNVRKQTTGNSNHSSEGERKKRTRKKGSGKGGSKKSTVKVNRTIKVTIDKTDLPADAKKAGIKTTIIQDISFTTDNIAFKRQMYYSLSEKKTYISPLPPGYEGEYGPNIKSWIKVLYSAVQVSNDNITWFLNTVGSVISNATVSRIITHDNTNEELHEEKIAIVKAGLKSTPYQNLDDTSGREKGQNCYVNVLTNEYFAAFFTLPSKDRLSIIDMLSIDGMKFLLNNTAFELMEAMHLPDKHIKFLKQYSSDKYFFRIEIDKLLAQMFPNPKKQQGYRKLILEASAIAAYRQSDYAIKHLIVDDAPQFKLITETLGLCWVHEGRHYKKLNPLFMQNKVILQTFIEEFWDYYRLLKDYKRKPSPDKAKKLGQQFDALFSKKTGYEKLDKQIATTKAKKDALLLVLKYPSIPLHNNSAELIARVQARIRDIHLHTMSIAGTKIKDTLATITMTAKKLGVNAFEYLFDKVTKAYKLTSLAGLIKIKASQDIINLDADLVPN